MRIVEYTSQNCPLAVELALSFAGRLASDLGAKVTIAPGSRTERRAMSPSLEGVSTLSHFLDAGKISWSDEPSGEGGLAALLRGADVVLADGMAHRAFPDAGEAIWALVSMRSDAAGEHLDSEFTLSAACGLLDLIGDPERRPLRLGGRQLAYAGGLSAYMGFTAALCARKAGSRTGLVRVNLADVGVWLNWKSVAMSTWGARSASRLGHAAEWRTVRCSDGWTAVVYLEADWPILRDLIDDPRLRDPRFDDRSVRRANAALITGAIEDFFIGLSREQLRDLALEKRIPLGPVWSPAELEHDPQYVARDFLRRVQVGGVAVLRPSAPVIWNGQRFAAGAAS